MQVELIADKQRWEDFIGNSRYKSFLQSWAWGEFQSDGLGKKIYRLVLMDKGKIVGLILAIEELTRFGKFIYIPRGGIFNWEDITAGQLAQLLKIVKDYFSDKGYMFLRMDPAFPLLTGNAGIVDKTFANAGFTDSVKPTQVERAWVIDIAHNTEEELLAWMNENGLRKRVRKYFSKAERKGVTIHSAIGEEGFKIFIELQKELTQRKNITTASADYFEKQFKYLVPEVLQLWYADFEGKVVATALLGMYGDEVSYLHGASSYDTKDTGASYYLHWRAMNYAREMGMKRYNMWGVVKEADFQAGHPGYGYSSFKRGFGGKIEEYIRSKEFAYRRFPTLLYRLQERYRLLKLKGTY